MPEEEQFTSYNWKATEFAPNDKTATWYLGLAAATTVFATFIYLLTKDKVSVGVIIFAALVFGVYAARKPRELQYSVDQRQLTIAEKVYPLGEFKSFSLLPEEGALQSIVFMPLKRFKPPLTIYFKPSDGHAIVAVLTSSLPYAEPPRDMVDNLMRRIKF